jgi:hypothetical protein
MVDVLHYVLLLYKLGRRDNIKNVLLKTGYGTKDSFFKFTQAISETLPNDSREKKLLDGFLSGKDRIMSDIENMVGRLRKRELFQK